MIEGRRRWVSRPSRRRWRLASIRVEPLTPRTPSSTGGCLAGLADVYDGVRRVVGAEVGTVAAFTGGTTPAAATPSACPRAVVLAVAGRHRRSVSPDARLCRVARRPRPGLIVWCPAVAGRSRRRHDHRGRDDRDGPRHRCGSARPSSSPSLSPVGSRPGSAARGVAGSGGRQRVSAAPALQAGCACGAERLGGRWLEQRPGPSHPQRSRPSCLRRRRRRRRRTARRSRSDAAAEPGRHRQSRNSRPSQPVPPQSLRCCSRLPSCGFASPAPERRLCPRTSGTRPQALPRAGLTMLPALWTMPRSARWSRRESGARPVGWRSGGGDWSPSPDRWSRIRRCQRRWNWRYCCRCALRRARVLLIRPRVRLSRRPAQERGGRRTSPRWRHTAEAGGVRMRSRVCECRQTYGDTRVRRRVLYRWTRPAGRSDASRPPATCRRSALAPAASPRG